MNKTQLKQKFKIIGYETWTRAGTIKKIPIIQTYKIDNITCGFWCPFCKRIHYHALEDGHRVAHCFSSDSPFEETGYIIKILEDFE